MIGHLLIKQFLIQLILRTVFTPILPNFIPQLAARIIHEHTDKGDIVIDPFMGSGTTIVEALVNQRIGIGVDINEIASLITKAKTTFIPAYILSYSYENLMDKLAIYTSQEADLLSDLKKLEKIDVNQFNLPERVDYWFKPHIKQRLIIILHHILQVKDSDARDLFLVIFAQILKSCSIWLQKSVKPTRDLNKQELTRLKNLLGKQSELLNAIKHLIIY